MKKIIVLFFLFISIVLTGEEFKFYEGTGDKTPFSNIDGIGKGVLDSIGTFPQKAGRLEIGTYGSISFLFSDLEGMDSASLKTSLWDILMPLVTHPRRSLLIANQARFLFIAIHK